MPEYSVTEYASIGFAIANTLAVMYYILMNYRHPYIEFTALVFLSLLFALAVNSDDSEKGAVFYTITGVCVFLIVLTFITHRYLSDWIYRTILGPYEYVSWTLLIKKLQNRFADPDVVKDEIKRAENPLNAWTTQYTAIVDSISIANNEEVPSQFLVLLNDIRTKLENMIDVLSPEDRERATETINMLSSENSEEPYPYVQPGAGRPGSDLEEE